MGYRSPIHPLELPDFKAENDEDSLKVSVVGPSARESGSLNAGRLTITEQDGTTREETSNEFMHRAMTLLAPKIRSWNLEDEDGVPVPLPRDVGDGLRLAGKRPEECAEGMVAHLMEQDENIVLAIYHEWRLVGLPKKADTDEGKDSAAQSTTGPGASPQNSEAWPPPDLRALENSIPMG